MIKKVYSRTLSSFKEMIFEKGLNFVLSQSVNDKPVNATGKTTLLEIINFVLCSSNSKRDSRLDAKELEGHSFSIEFLFNDKVVELTRIVGTDEVLYSDYSLEVFDKDEGVLQLDKIKEYLFKAFFNQSSQRASFRSIISPFMRKGDFAFNSPTKTHTSEASILTQMRNGFLTGFSLSSLSHMHEAIRTRENESILKRLNEEEILWEKLPIRQLEKEKSDLECKITNLKQILLNFEDRIDSKEEIVDLQNLNIKLNRNYKQMVLLDNQIEHITKNLRGIKSRFSNTEKIQELLDEVGIFFTPVANNKVEEVQNFHREISLIRKNYFTEQLDLLYTKRDNLNNNIAKTLNRKLAIIEMLNVNKNEIKINEVIDDLSSITERLNNIKERILLLNEIKELNERSEELSASAIKSLNEEMTTSSVEDFKATFEDLTKSVFGKKGTIDVAIEDRGQFKNRGLNFSWNIPKELSKGYKKACIALYDYSLLINNQDFQNLFLIHDSDIFESTDYVINAKMLNTIYSTLNPERQYIVVLNEQEVDYATLQTELLEKLLETPNKLSQDSPLLGITIEKRK